MALRQPATHHVSLVVHVPRDAAGDLTEGVRERLRRVDGVTALTVEDVTGVRPTLNDLRVDVEAAVRVDPTLAPEPSADGDEKDPPVTAHVEDVLSAGFGVHAVRVERDV